LAEWQQPWRKSNSTEKTPTNKKAVAAATAFGKLLVAPALTTIAPAPTIATTAAAAVAAATATITTVTAAAAASTTKAATTATAAARAIFAWFGFVDVQCTTIDFLAIKLSDGCLALFLAGHFDEAEAT
jgi:hypothetical protein